MSENEVYKFLFGKPKNARDALLAVSIANQQRAGFGNNLDVREFKCPKCDSPGFNSGWGFIEYTCGAKSIGADDFEPCEDNGKEEQGND